MDSNLQFRDRSAAIFRASSSRLRYGLTVSLRSGTENPSPPASSLRSLSPVPISKSIGRGFPVLCCGRGSADNRVTGEAINNLAGAAGEIDKKLPAGDMVWHIIGFSLPAQLR